MFPIAVQVIFWIFQAPVGVSMLSLAMFVRVEPHPVRQRLGLLPGDARRRTPRRPASSRTDCRPSPVGPGRPAAPGDRDIHGVNVVPGGIGLPCHPYGVLGAELSPTGNCSVASSSRRRLVIGPREIELPGHCPSAP